MSLKLMYITNDPAVAGIAQDAGVDRIFVDMEYVGKDLRQGGMDTVKSRHTLEDVTRLRRVVDVSELLVRCNPIHPRSAVDLGSEAEVEGAVQAGADIVMLPFFKTPEEVELFVGLVEGRCRTMLLVETREAVERIDEVLAVPGVDEVYVGLNDLSLSYGMKFMFQPLAEGMVDGLAARFKAAGLPFGFGGISALGTGSLPAEAILREHYRLGSGSVILSRSFCDTKRETDLAVIEERFERGVAAIRAKEACIAADPGCLRGSHAFVRRRVAEIIGATQKRGSGQ